MDIWWCCQALGLWAFGKFSHETSNPHAVLCRLGKTTQRYGKHHKCWWCFYSIRFSFDQGKSGFKKRSEKKNVFPLRRIWRHLVVHLIIKWAMWQCPKPCFMSSYKRFSYYTCFTITQKSENFSYCKRVPRLTAFSVLFGHLGVSVRHGRRDRLDPIDESKMVMNLSQEKSRQSDQSRFGSGGWCHLNALRRRKIDENGPSKKRWFLMWFLMPSRLWWLKNHS